MFKSDEEGVVLLGVPKLSKKKVSMKYNEEKNQSFLGGRPMWFGSCTNFKEETLNRTLTCSKCVRPLMFLCQIYAPTDDLVRHLLIYGCNNGKCGNVSGSFRVLRIQNTYVEENQNDVEESSKELESNSTSTPSWTVEGADDWTVDGADDWNVDGADEWGNNGDEDSSASISTDKKKPLVATPTEKVEDSSASISTDKKKPLVAPSIEKEKINTDKPAPPIPLPKSFMNTKTFPLCELETIQEPYESAESDGEKKLTVSAAAAAMEALKLDVAESVASGETYESVPEDKRLFLKFRQRVSRYPSQCFRYAYGGEPLWDNFITDREKVPNCKGCGSKRVFEAQLTPQVLHCLRVDDFADSETNSSSSDGISKNKTSKCLSLRGMDWGGIYIYACPHSCNESCEEYVYVSTTETKTYA
eukprot:g7344.t1